MDSETLLHDAGKTEHHAGFKDDHDAASKASKFEPIDRQRTSPDIQVPDQAWLTIFETPCTFPPEVFTEVMLNLVKNPNITSSYLFRADIFYDSGHAEPSPSAPGPSKLLPYLKPDYKPRSISVPGYELLRAIVRQLIPRNPQLDQALLQTCLFFRTAKNDEGETERNLVIFIPHVESPAQIPFYHPAVSSLAFLHTWPINDASEKAILSISYHLFPSAASSSSTTPTEKLHRTAFRLLETIHKHGQGQLAGYSKRVHHDQIIPQKRYQDTYTRLKGKYGRRLAGQWVEATEPGKHVFEDLGIAAFLIELWREMYRVPSDRDKQDDDDDDDDNDNDEAARDGRQKFPGFVDIGCGNGVLVHILLSEGYAGSGFDARERKTWSILPDSTRQHLHTRLLVPDIFLSSSSSSTHPNPHATPAAEATTIPPYYHPGIFPPGTFIISNHADELTIWTPLLAYLNSPSCSFIAIPCCSHDLSGARFRAPLTTKATTNTTKTSSPNPLSSPISRLPQQTPASSSSEAAKRTQVAETGTLKRSDAQKKLPSAYSSLCSYVTSLAEELGFEIQKEVLRIPSTRNLCIVGRTPRWERNVKKYGEEEEEAKEGADEAEKKKKREKVREVVEREMGRSVEVVGREWIARADGLRKKPGSGH